MTLEIEICGKNMSFAIQKEPSKLTGRRVKKFGNHAQGFRHLLVVVRDLSLNSFESFNLPIIGF